MNFVEQRPSLTYLILSNNSNIIRTIFYSIYIVYIIHIYIMNYLFNLKEMQSAKKTKRIEIKIKHFGNDERVE